MTADLPARLQAVRAELEAATPGGWEVYSTRATEWAPYYGIHVVGHPYRRIVPARVDWEGFGHGATKEDAAFIASAPDTVARLLAAVEAVVGLHKPVHVSFSGGQLDYYECDVCMEE